ncbi:MAG TPA: plasmid mobilization relaxosome protein MobC [Parafilimonas sp.]|nr:plasmid mobilization relaxosome protein MobC [Parafilimonas sp.]
MENATTETSQKTIKKSIGGRPKKLIKQDHFIGIKCSASEKETLQQKAKANDLSLSEFLRETALKGQPVIQIKALPKEILLFTATLNHLAANINQIAKQCNTYNQLTAFERIELQMLSIQIKQLATDIKNYLK